MYTAPLANLVTYIVVAPSNRKLFCVNYNIITGDFFNSESVSGRIAN